MRCKVDERSPERHSTFTNPLILQFMLHRKGAHKHSFTDTHSGSLFSSTTDQIFFPISQLYPFYPVSKLCLYSHSPFAFLGLYFLVFLLFLIFLFTVFFKRSTQFYHTSSIVLCSISLEFFPSFCLKPSPSFLLAGSLENYKRHRVILEKWTYINITWKTSLCPKWSPVLLE